jgi:hypothetical protein
MTSHSDFAKAIQIYGGACDDVSKRVIQDRTLHMHDMGELYMMALKERMPSEYLSTVEQAIGERSVYNTRKMIMDAADFTAHDRKLNGVMGPNMQTLAGGGVVDTSRAALDGMKYSAMRSNALYANFNQKLAHDRELHMQELQALYSVTPSSTASKHVLKNFIASRQQNNNSRTHHDANMWASTDRSVANALGGGYTAKEVLYHGVEGKLMQNHSRGGMRGGGHPGGIDTHGLPLHNEEAARLWGEILQGGSSVF